MDYIVEHWRGELSVNQSFWLSSLLSALISLLVTSIVWSIALHNHHLNLGNLIGGDFADIDFESFEHLVPLPLKILSDVVDVTLGVWWSVGAWKTCDNANALSGKRFGYAWTKFFIAFGFLLDVLFDTIDFF